MIEGWPSSTMTSVSYKERKRNNQDVATIPQLADKDSVVIRTFMSYIKISYIFLVIKGMSSIWIVLVKQFINIGFDESIKSNFRQQIYFSFESASNL